MENVKTKKWKKLKETKRKEIFLNNSTLIFCD